MSKIVYDGAEHIPKQNRDQLSTRWINFVSEAKRVGFTTMHSLSIMPPKCKMKLISVFVFNKAYEYE